MGTNMLRQKILLLCLLNFTGIAINAVGDEEIQKMVETAVKNEVEQALHPQDSHRFLKILGFVGVTGTMYLLWTKYGWATRRDVKRELGDGARKDTKEAFNKVELASKKQFDTLENKTDSMQAKIDKAREDFQELMADDRERYQETQRIFSKLGNNQKKLLEDYWNKSESFIWNTQIINKKTDEVVGLGKRLLELSKSLYQKKKIMVEGFSQIDRDYENLLNEVENNGADQEKIALLIQQNKLSADQIEQLFLNGACKLSLLIEQAEAYKQLNQSTEYTAIHKKIDANVQAAQELFDVVNQHKQDLLDLKSQLKDIKTDNENMITGLKEQAQINQQDGPLVPTGNKKKRAARFKNSGITVANQDLGNGRALGWK